MMCHCHVAVLFVVSKLKDLTSWSLQYLQANLNHLSPLSYSRFIALGMHRDHQFVFQAALNTLDCDRVLFFEDFPYATYYSKDELIEYIKPYNMSFIEVDISECFEQRIAASEAYQSQIPTLFNMASSFRELIRASTLEAGKQQRPIERYWRIPR